MATGKTPFGGNRRRRSLPPCLPRIRRGEHGQSSYAQRLDAIVEKLLRNDPAPRYASAAQLREDLESLDASATRPAAKAAGRSGHGGRRAGLLLLIAGGLAWWKYRPVLRRAQGAGGERQWEGAAGLRPRQPGLDHPG